MKIKNKLKNKNQALFNNKFSPFFNLKSMDDQEHNNPCFFSFL